MSLPVRKVQIPPNTVALPDTGKRPLLQESRSKHAPPSPALGYGLALLSVTLVALLQTALHRSIGVRSPFLLLTLPVLFSAWYGGMGPGLLALGLGTVVGDFLFVPPYRTFHFATPSDLLQALMYVAVSGCVLGIIAAQQREKARAQAQTGALNAQAARLQSEIAERERIERRQQEHLEEIEALNTRLRSAMAESHHRVKNSLQLVASMIDMRLMEELGAYPPEDFQRLGIQVQTLAAIHDLLTQSAKADGDVQRLSSKAVLNRLLPMLQNTVGTQTITSNLSDLPLTIRQGASLAMIINELVSNAAKYGRSRIHVLMRAETGQARVVVSDDGPGFPPGFDVEQAANTGLELVTNLSRWDMGGSVAFACGENGGAQITLTFPLRFEDWELFGLQSARPTVSASGTDALAGRA